MAIVRSIVLNPVEPALLSIRSPLGVGLELGLTFLKQNQTPQDPTPLMPQLALLPRSARQVFAYDVGTTNVAEGTASVSVPGSALIDSNGYNLELYQRRAAQNPADPPVAVGLIAKGVLRLEGNAYMQFGPLGMINTPVIVGPPGRQGEPGPPGGPGVPGDPGQRGSIWTTGIGPPVALTGVLIGDMYLDEGNGDVWRFGADGWTLGTF